MFPKKDVSSKWANTEATTGQKERKRGKGKKSKSGNQGVSEGGKEAKKGRDGNEGNAGKPFNHAASSTETKVRLQTHIRTRTSIFIVFMVLGCLLASFWRHSGT